MISTTNSVAIPLVDDVTTANNVSDKPFYPDLISCLSSETLKKIHYMVADPGYDDQKLYDFSMSKGFQLICPVRRYKNTPEERKELVDFYQSALGQIIYSRRIILVEPLIEHIKSVFGIDPVPARGFDKVRNIMLLSVL
ncbi:hypothetical protein BH23THE1_BH23THE1_20670 [soil metagenome]